MQTRRRRAASTTERSPWRSASRAANGQHVHEPVPQIVAGRRWRASMHRMRRTEIVASDHEASRTELSPPPWSLDHWVWSKLQDVEESWKAGQRRSYNGHHHVPRSVAFDLGAVVRFAGRSKSGTPGLRSGSIQRVWRERAGVYETRGRRQRSLCSRRLPC